MLRKKPRPHTGRIVQERIRRPVADEPNAEELAHWARLRRKGCCVTGALTDTAIHHVPANMPEKRVRRDHRFVVCLASWLHNGSDVSVHGLGSEAKFEERHGVDLVQIARDEWEESCRVHV